MQNDVYELTVYQSLLGQTFVNSMHVREAAAALTDAERQTTLQQVADNFKTMLKTNQINTLTYSTWRATQVLGSNVTWPAATCKRVGGRVLEGALTGTLTGSEAGGAPTPTFAAQVIKEGTGFGGRARKGRIHIGGISTVFYQGTGQWNASGGTQLTAAIATFRAFYGPVTPAASWELVVFSKRLASGCAPGAAHPHAMVSKGDQDLANSYKPITSMVASPSIGTMVKRKVGVGI